MTWWKKLEPIHKALAAMLAMFVMGMAFMAYSTVGQQEMQAIGDQTEVNRTDIAAFGPVIELLQETDAQAIETLEVIQADVTLVRCWARAEIEGTDARRCLFEGGGL